MQNRTLIWQPILPLTVRLDRPAESFMSRDVLMLSVDLCRYFGQCQKLDDIFLWRLAMCFGSFSASFGNTAVVCFH